MAQIAESYLSIRRKDKFCYDDYSYRFDKNSTKDPKLSFWRCDNGTCKARQHLRDGAVVQELGEHLSHAPNQPKIAAAIAVSRMKDQARNTRDSTRQILADTQEGLSETTIVSLPSKMCLVRTIQRQRQKDKQHPRLPTNLADLGDIPQDLKVKL